METIPPWISILISSCAFLIAVLTAYLTFFRKGQLQMTQPTVIFFGSDGPNFDGKNKVFLRTLLFSTAKRGQVLESLYISLKRGESRQNFNIWVYGDKGDLKRGSGLFVPQEGVAFDHHFLLPEDGANFNFLSGSYNIRVYAKIFGSQDFRELLSTNVNITETLAERLSKPNTGLYFDWGPDQQSYHPHILAKPEIDFKEMYKSLIDASKGLAEKDERFG
jgi:hypothetical protein